MKAPSILLHKREPQRGMSLVGVMIAVAVLSIVTLGSMTLTASILEAGAKARFDNDITNELMEVRILLSNEATCTANMKGRTLTANNYSNYFSLKGYDTTTASLTSDNLISSNILKEFRIRQKTDTVATLSARFETQGDVLGSKEIFRDVTLAIEKDGSGTILKCSTLPLPAPGGSTGAVSEEKARCFSQGGALNSQFPLPFAQCKAMAYASCKMVENCVDDQRQVQVGSGSWTSCLWTCKLADQ